MDIAVKHLQRPSLVIFMVASVAIGSLVVLLISTAQLGLAGLGM